MGVLESVYGELDVTVASSKPGFLKQIPEGRNGPIRDSEEWRMRLGI